MDRKTEVQNMDSKTEVQNMDRKTEVQNMGRKTEAQIMDRKLLKIKKRNRTKKLRINEFFKFKIS